MTDTHTTETRPDELDEAWRVDGDRTATWALRKLRQTRDERHRITAAYEAERIRLALEETTDVAPLDSKIAWWEGKLVEYYHQLEALAPVGADGQPDFPKTYKLPGGRICRRAGRTRIDVTDERALTDWLLANDPALLKMAPSKSGLGAYTHTDGRVVSPDGEALPGVEIVRSEDSYTVQT